MKQEEYVIKTPISLMDFLFAQYKDYSRKKIKTLLGSGQIYINGRSTTQFNAPLIKGDKVVIKNTKFYGAVSDRRLKIIEETDDYIVVNKPAGLLSVSTDKEKIKTMFHIVSDYVKQKNSKNKIFIVHRLDKETSGVLLFAKSEKAKALYQDNWDKIVKRREYLAVVEGSVSQEAGTLESYLVENKNMMVYSTKNKEEGKLAITEYKKKKERKNLTWLEINIKTGRKNQIRVHMKEFLFPIAGDKKYGATTDPFRRLALHASKIVIQNPVTKQLLEWKADTPDTLK